MNDPHHRRPAAATPRPDTDPQTSRVAPAAAPGAGADPSDPVLLRGRQSQ